MAKTFHVLFPCPLGLNDSANDMAFCLKRMIAVLYNLDYRKDYPRVSDPTVDARRVLCHSFIPHIIFANQIFDDIIYLSAIMLLLLIASP